MLKEAHAEKSRLMESRVSRCTLGAGWERDRGCVPDPLGPQA